MMTFRMFLAVVGVIAVVLILFAWFYWCFNTRGMTPEQKKAHQKKVDTICAIGIPAFLAMGAAADAMNRNNNVDQRMQQQQAAAYNQRVADYQRMYAFWQQQNWNNPNPPPPPVFRG